MQLRQLLAALPGVPAVSGPDDITINHITSDSRQVLPGALFVAYRGTGIDGHRFLPDALARGAAAVVGEQDVPGLPVPYVRVVDGREALAWLLAAWYGHPSRTMSLVGVTGTDGKTTTANLIYNIARCAGLRTGLISTVNAVIAGETYETGLHTTTPDAADVQRYLAQMRDAGTDLGILEATSHGLAQHRVTGCAFDVAVVTNITHEHLDFHGSYEAYREAKAGLFRSLMANPRKGSVAKTAVLNRDDSSYGFLAAIPAERQITYGYRPAGPVPGAGQTALTATRIMQAQPGAGMNVELLIQGPDADTALPLRSPLLGDFNVYNIMAAAAAALSLGLPLRAIQDGVAGLAGIPGRMEAIDLGQDFLAFVDFAHTPFALARALETARGLAAPGGRVVAVFGCAGLRDREKRRMMGDVAAALADYVVITAEDPRTEDLAAIMAETASACQSAGRKEARDFVRIADRQRAISHAVSVARTGDVIMVCGKGHEQSMCFGTTEFPWRDQDALRWALAAGREEAPGDPPHVLPTWSEASEG